MHFTSVPDLKSIILFRLITGSGNNKNAMLEKLMLQREEPVCVFICGSCRLNNGNDVIVDHTTNDCGQ